MNTRLYFIHVKGGDWSIYVKCVFLMNVKKSRIFYLAYI